MKKTAFLLVLLSQIVVAQNKEFISLSKSSTIPAIKELTEFVAIPNDALYPEDIDKNIVWLEKAFKARGFSTKTLPTSKTPLFYAEKQSSNRKAQTVLFYMHFDGQSIDPSKWDQENPYKVVLKKSIDNRWETIDWNKLSQYSPDWRLFGRSTADDKGPIVMMLKAIDIMKAKGWKQDINIKVILDGEEEKGSSHLPATVEKYKELLSADHMIINDGPMHLSGEPTIIYGCRGVTRVDLRVFGAIKHQHSGHYGNYAPNPVFHMSRILSSMKDDKGRVLVKGYYDGIEFDEETKSILASVPDRPEDLNKLLGIAQPESVGENLQSALQYPSLNVRGFQAAWVGDQARTIIPSEAVASMDLRLVPESDPVRLQGLIKRHIEELGFLVIDREPTMEERENYDKIAQLQNGGATLPFRTAFDSETGQLVEKSLIKGWGKDPIKIRTMGGTVPITDFINLLGIPAVIVPLVNPDNNQHSPNENLRISNLTNGIATFLSLFTSS